MELQYRKVPIKAHIMKSSEAVCVQHILIDVLI